MDGRRAMLLAAMLAALVGPQRCYCGIPAVAAPEPTGMSGCCCACSDASCVDGCPSSAETEHATSGEGHEPDGEGCPSRDKPRQAWDTAGDGPTVDLRPGSGVMLAVDSVPATGRLLTAASVGPPRSPGERSASGGRGLLVLLQILRC